MSVSPNTFNCSNIGNNTVTLTVTDSSGNTDTCTATVTIQDVTPPDASCNNVTITIDAITGLATITDLNTIYSGSGDTCSGVTLNLSQTVFSCSEIGDNTETLTITDASGNSSSCTTVITVEAPIITSGTLTGEVVNPVPDNPDPPSDLIEVTACPGGVAVPKDVELTLNLDASSTIVAANISTWQISTDEGTTWTDVAGTAGLLQHTLLNLTTTTLVRLVIQSGSCLNISPLAIIRFLPPDEPPTIISVSNTNICLGDSVTIEAESFFEYGGQFGGGGYFNQAQPEGWRVDGIDGFFPASGNNQSEPTWKETNGPTIQGGIRYDTSDNTKFAVAWGPYDTTLETPIFNTIGMSASEAVLEFYQAYYFCNGASGAIELSLDGGNTYNITLNTQQGDNLSSPNNSGVQVINNSGSCGGGPNGQRPTSDPFQFASVDLSAYIGMANLRIRFSYNGLGAAECTNQTFPAHPNNSCNNIPTTFDVYSGWVIDDVGFPYAPIDEVLEWTDEDGNVITTGNTVSITPITPGVQEYGVTALVNGCRADTDDGTEFVNINTSLAFAGPDFAPAAGECGQSTFVLRAYDNNLTAVENFNLGNYEAGLYVVPDVPGGDTDYPGTGVNGEWSIISDPPSTCGTTASFSSMTNPNATFTGEPGTYTLRWTLDNGCFDEVDITITSCSGVDFDGVDDYVTFRNNYTLDTSFSLELWVKPNALSGIRTLFSKKLPTSNTEGYEFVIENAIPKFKWYSASGNGTVDSQYPITTNRWYHLAVTFDGSNYLLYVDGIEVGTTTGTINAPDSTNSSVECLLGARDNANGFTNNATNFFEGWMDELRVWNQVLTAAQIRQMMNQEIDDNGAVRGEVVPLDVPGLNWTALDGYYRMNDACGNFTAYKGVGGRLRNINSSMPQTAPLPYTSRVDGQNWGTDNTWTNFQVWDPPNSNGVDGTAIDWNIAQISHDIDSGDKNITLLGLISDTSNKELTISDPGTAQNETNDGQSLRVTHYLKLDGDIDLVGESQLLQDQNSILDVTSAGKLQRDQQGTTNLFNYNYWSPPVSPVNTTANNTDFNVDAILKDGSDSNNPLNFLWTNSYDADPSTTPITMSRRWLWAYENYPFDTYAAWNYIQETGTISVGLGFTMKGSGVGDPIADVQNYVFEGKPNNGTITTPITIGYQALVGNPYPSAMDGNEFILDNIPGGNTGTSSSFDGTIYFWEHYTSNFTHILEDYEGGYATYNLTGGNAAISPPLVSGNGTPTKFPGRYIPVGQGFFVTASPTGGNITFHNDQRVYVKESIGTSVFMEANNNDMTINGNSFNTYSTPDDGDDDADEDLIQRVRISCKTPEGAIRSLLLGFVPNGQATNYFDPAYDAANTDELPSDFSWIIEESFYTTQGVGDFIPTSMYNLNATLAESGVIEISLHSLENFDEEIDVYVYDYINNSYYRINDNVYHLYLESGSHDKQFYITFFKEDDETLGNGEVDVDSIIFNYLRNSQEIYLYNTNNLPLESISLTNLLGQEILHFDSNSIDTYNRGAELRIPVPESLAEGTYILRIASEGKSYNKKVIISY